MNMKPFSFDEFVKIGVGEEGLAIWKDRSSGMHIEDLAKKYGMRYSSMSSLLTTIRSHIGYYEYAESYKGRDCERGIFIILTVYSAYLVEDQGATRLRAVNAILRNCSCIEEFLAIPELQFLKWRSVGTKTVDFILKIREEMMKQLSLSEVAG